jgi:hypothetical protein
MVKGVRLIVDMDLAEITVTMRLGLVFIQNRMEPLDAQRQGQD